MELVLDDIRTLVLKHESNMEPLEILRKIQTIAELEASNLILHKRLQDDVFDIFEKDDESHRLIGDGDRLCSLSRVIMHQSNRSCSQFSCEVTIELSESNITKQDVGVPSKPIESIKKAYQSRKKRKTYKEMSEDSVSLMYSFSEISVSDQKRENGVSVIESPCRTINLTISMSRGRSGVDKCTLVDFQLLTASFSPSDEQILLRGDDDGDDSCCSDNKIENGVFTEGSQLEKVISVATADEEKEPDTDPGDDCSDYYHVMVDSQSILKLCDWISFGAPAVVKKGQSESRCCGEDKRDESTRHKFYQTHERCADILMFLLSVPFVDDAWGIHTLILDHELGAQESDEESESC